MRDYDLKELNESSVEKDITSIDLLRDFVKEKLGGDISTLEAKLSEGKSAAEIIKAIQNS